MFIWQTPPTWFNPLDQHERITARSSTQVAMCGSQSETQIPLWPCCFHFRCEARSGERPSPMGVITGLKLGGNGWPASRFSSGLGSNVSRWLGPPSMNRKMTLLAVAGPSPRSGDRMTGALDSGPAARVARQQVQQSQRTKAGAGLEQPVAAGQRRHSMRIRESMTDLPDRLVYIQEFIGIQEHMTEVDEGRVVGRRRSIAGDWRRASSAWRFEKRRGLARSRRARVARPKARR